MHAVQYTVKYNMANHNWVAVPQTGILKGSHSFTCTPRFHPLMEWTIPAFSFPAKAGPSLTDPVRIEGWVGLGVWLHREKNVQHWELNPDTVAHLDTNQARRRLTLLIETNVLPLCQHSVASCMQVQYTVKYNMANHNLGSTGFLLLCRIHFPWLFQTKWIIFPD